MQPSSLLRLIPVLLMAIPGCFSPNAAVEDSDEAPTTGGQTTTAGPGAGESSSGMPASGTAASTSTGDSDATTTGLVETDATSEGGSTTTTGGETTSGGAEEGSSDSTTGSPISFEGDYEGVILGDCTEFPTGLVDVDGTLEFAVFEVTAMAGSADLTVPYSDNTVPLSGTIDERGVVAATLDVSGSVSCSLVGNAPGDGEMNGTFTCETHACEGLWSASLL